MTRVQKGGSVDNLVLICSTITSDFLANLRTNEDIQNVYVKNLVEYGDPIVARMSGLEVMLSAPILGYQMVQGTGHFYYAPSGEEGMMRRRQLAVELYYEGLR